MIPASAGQLPVAIGPYRVEQLIGSGGVGVVYRARHEATGEVVALKTVAAAREAHLASVRREIQMLKQVRHTGIVRIFDGGVFEGRPWYAMELLEGKTFLSSVLDVTREFSAGATHSSSSPSSSSPPSPPRSWLSPSSQRHQMDASTVDQLPGPSSGEGGNTSRAMPPSTGLGGTRNVGGAGRTVSRDEIVDVLTAVRRLCTPLAFLHGEGMVHRDLKPTNIFIRPDGTPVLMDFGLAWRAHGTGGREVLEIVAGRSGTAGYMAPEQINGDMVDARTDLYALGCLLYEGVAGRLPFTGSTQEILDKHLYLPPVPVRNLAPDIPAELDALILRLLAKRPSDRLGHANDVAEALARLGAEGWPFPEEGQPRAYLYRPTVSGREDVLGSLTEALDRTKAGEGGMVLLTGESGIGKTAVAAELMRVAAAKGFRVVTGACVAVNVTQPNSHSDFGAQGGAPLHPFGTLLQAIADRCTARGVEETERLLGPRLKVLVGCEPAVGAVPVAVEHPDPPRLPGQAAQKRLLDALGETISLFVEDKPLLLVIDDLQWADEVSLRFFESLPEDFFFGRGLLIVATCRSEDLSAADKIRARPFATHLELGRLGAPALARLIGDMLALPEAPQEIVRFLTNESTGNPFFVAEYLRAAVTMALLARDAAGRWKFTLGESPISGLPLPRSLSELLERRLAGLAGPARRVVQMGAVLGREVEPDLLVALLPEAGDTENADATKELLARQIFETMPDGQLRFTHDKLREGAYAAIPPDERRACHRAAAIAIEARASGSANFALSYARLAHHYSEAGEVSHAVEYLEKAGEQAHKNFANREALGFFKQAILLSEQAGMPIEPLRRARWERHLGSACSGLGLLAESMNHLQDAVRVLGWPMPRSRARLIVSLLGQVVRQAVHRLLAHLIVGSGQQHKDRYREGARAYDLLMPISYYVTGDLAQILYATVRNLNVAELAGPSPELALAYSNAHATTALIPAFSLAQAYGDLARETLKGLDDQLVESWVYVMNGAYCAGLGRFDEALEYSERIVRIAGAIRFPRRLEEGFALRGTTYLLRGQLEEAKVAYDQVRASAERGDPQTLTWALVGMAHVAVRQGDAEAARRLAEEGEALLRKDLGRPERIYTYGTLALAYLAVGDLPRARATVDRAADWIGKGSPVSFYNIHSYAAVAEVYLELWARATGDDKIELQECLRQAQKQLRKCGRVFPAGRAAAWYWRGQIEARAGRAKQALRSWERARGLAALHGLMHDGAQADAAIGTLRAGV